MLCFIHLAPFFRRDGQSNVRAEDGPNQPVIGTVRIGLVGEPTPYQRGSARRVLKRAPGLVQRWTSGF